MNKKLSLSILMPVYNASGVLKQVLTSILHQSFSEYELIITDDNRPEKLEEIIKTKQIINSFKDSRIRYIKNKKNLGTQQNIRKLFELAKGDIVFYMADDLLAKDALQKTYDAFFLEENIGAVTRPFYWYDKDYKNPVRAIYPPNSRKDTILSIFDGEPSITAIFGSVGQISGLAYRKEWVDTPFHNDIFPGHIYPFAGLMKKHKCVYLKDYTVAVGIQGSQTRSITKIYDTSPTEQWIRMFKAVYSGPKYKIIRDLCIKHIATHAEGLVQLKNYAKRGVLEKEIMILIKNYPANLINLNFLFYVILTEITPRPIMRKLTDYYKSQILSNKLKNIQFETYV